MNCLKWIKVGVFLIPIAGVISMAFGLLDYFTIALLGLFIAGCTITAIKTILEE